MSLSGQFYCCWDSPVSTANLFILRPSLAKESGACIPYWDHRNRVKIHVGIDSLRPVGSHVRLIDLLGTLSLS